MRLAAIFVATALAASGAENVLTFQPQGAITSRVSAWSVGGCVEKAVPVQVLYAIATRHGIPWITPKTAGELFAKKSAWSRAVKAAGWVSAGGAVLTGFDVIRTKPQVVASFAIGGGLILALLPLAAREIPQVDPAAGGPLMISTDGCGSVSFYAAPSGVAGFNEVLP